MRKKTIIFLVITFFSLNAFNSFLPNYLAIPFFNNSVFAKDNISGQREKFTWWEIQSIDTMKFSRDPSREFLNDQLAFEKTVTQQVRAVAEIGATHLGVATPYDDEFLPILNRWVEEARKYNLKIWFRGNFSGWESWFGYPRITREEHLEKMKLFIISNPYLFEDGDIFSACPECENGGPGDPRFNGDAEGHRKFLIEEHIQADLAFKKINKSVDTRFNSMNGDVAKLIMDPQTTASLGGIVVIDHYVRDPERLNDDISKYATQSKGKVFLGEMGAPIPDIHGNMSEQQQADWMQKTFQLISKNTDLIGLNYWTNQGGSTALWTDKTQPKPAVDVIRNFFNPKVIEMSINSNGKLVKNASVSTPYHSAISDDQGLTKIPYLDEDTTVIISKTSFKTVFTSVNELHNNSAVGLEPIQRSWWKVLFLNFKKLFFL